MQKTIVTAITTTLLITGCATEPPPKWGYPPTYVSPVDYAGAIHESSTWRMGVFGAIPTALSMYNETTSPLDDLPDVGAIKLQIDKQDGTPNLKPSRVVLCGRNLGALICLVAPPHENLIPAKTGKPPYRNLKPATKEGN